MSATTINQLATWMIEHPCIDSDVLEGRDDDTARTSGPEILLSSTQVCKFNLFKYLYISNFFDWRN